MSQFSACWLLGLSLCAFAPPLGGTERTEAGPNGDFSITFPSSWRAVPTRWGEQGQLGLFSEHPFDISIVVASRPLNELERALDRGELLDRMIELTMINTVLLGNKIIEVGRVESLVEDWPAFATVATNADRSKIMTNLRSFVRDRAYNVTTLTDNLQGSTDLGETVTRVVRSLTIHHPAGQARRPESVCSRWP